MARHILLYIVMLLSCSLAALGQTAPQGVKVNVRGTVYEHENLHPMLGASVKLLDGEGAMVSGTTTAKNGQFVLPAVPVGSYTLKVSFMGFREQSFKLTLPAKGGNYRVNDVLMREETTLMQEAVVEGKLPEMTVVDDTVVYHAGAYKLQDGALVEELIEKLPGVVKDDDGNYTWNGKSINQILVDGKEFFGNNRSLILKNLPAEIIDKVKAYDKQSDRARITGIDDGEEQTVLDLTIKKDRKRGWFGNIDGSYGTHDRYSGNLRANRFVGDQKFSMFGNGNNTQGNGMTDTQRVGATMNWQQEHIELNGSASGEFSQSGQTRVSNSQSFENPLAAYSNSYNHNSNRNNGFSMQYRVEWKPDSMTNILIRPEFSLRGTHSQSQSESAAWNDDPYARPWITDPLAPTQFSALLGEGIGVNHHLNGNHNENSNLNVRASVQYNRRLQKPGRNVTLNVDGGYSHSDSQSQSYSSIDYYQILAMNGGDSVYHKVQYNEAPQVNRNFSTRLSYSEPVGDRMFLQMSYQYSWRFSDHDREVSSIFDYMSDGAGGLYTPFLLHSIGRDNYRDFAQLAARDVEQCNYTTNTYQNHNLNLQYRINRTQYSLSVGANLQPQINSVDYNKGLRHYDVTQRVFNASPTFFFRYKFSRQEQVEVRYNGNTGQPSITDLIPDTLSNANPLNIRLGNAELKPSFTSNFQANYRRSVPDLQRSYALNLQFRSTQNSTTNRTQYDELTGGRVTMPVNVNGNWNGSTSFNFNTALDENKYWRINTTTQGSMTNSISFVYQKATLQTVRNRTRGANLSQSLRLTYRREWESKWQIEANVNGNIRYNHSRSTNTSASNLDTYTFSYGGSAVLTMPWGMTLSTDMGEHSRRGYTAASMNTDQFIWNASLSQRLLPKRNLTLSVRAVDILNRRDEVSRNISTTSRTDTRSDMVHSYVLFTVNYRFGKFGGRGQRGAGRGERTEAFGDEGGERMHPQGEGGRGGRGEHSRY